MLRRSSEIYIPEIRTARWTFPRTATAILDTLTDTIIATIFRWWIIAFAVFPLDTAAAGPRTLAISSPFAPLTVHRFKISARNALTVMAPFVDAAGSAVSPWHMLGMTLLMMISEWCGAPQSPAHCLTNNQPHSQFTSIHLSRAIYPFDPVRIIVTRRTINER